MLQELIDQQLKQEQAGKADRQRSHLWSPSRMGRCYRFQYWNRKGELESNPVDILGLRRFKVGDLFHDYVQMFFSKDQCEVMVTKDDIIGFCDVVTFDAVYDIKTVKEWEFKHIEDHKFDVNKDKDTHCYQLATYAWILGKPKALLCFINIANFGSLEFPIDLDLWIPKVKEELSRLRNYWDKNELPKAEPRAYGGKECQYCNYRTKCEQVEREAKNGLEKS
jgi:CRISPR/Cas system-associated exonuclease Cas4 (RecB family)